MKLIPCLSVYLAFSLSKSDGFVWVHHFSPSTRRTAVERKLASLNDCDGHDHISSKENSSQFTTASIPFANIGRRTAMQMALLFSAGAAPTRVSAASKSRSDGYAIQKTDEEWRSLLTPRQYEILREGGTERQFSSILVDEKREGIFYCAGCGAALFTSKSKFNSQTGWPSFASALDGVEVEQVNIVQSNLGGAELRCKTCGGHLGDVFKDGFIFVGTPAAETGKRYCIDGSALVFKPADDAPPVVGDQVPR
jgi:peptide-methionine (R)-S-oxide reductase